MGVKLSANTEELRRKFYTLTTPRDIADLLEVEYSHLIYHLYKVPTSEQYKTFTISKRSGDTRTISAPATPLKIIQRKLNYVLQHIYQPKAPAHAYLPSKSIVSNAKMHVKQRYVLGVDLKDFFPSITFKRVRGLFEAIPYERNRSVSTVLARICCYENMLPQGAPSSPIISNMICARMDSQLRRLAVKHRCVYTRYADDLTFSTSMRMFPAALAAIVPVRSANQLVIGPELDKAIKMNGFKINYKKLRLQTNDRSQVVTGLIVNRFPNVGRRYLRQIRAMLHAWERHGLENAESEYRLKYDKRNRSPYKPEVSFEQVVKGKIEFLGMVRGKDDPVYLRFLLQLAKLAPELVDRPKKEIEDELDYDIKLIEVLTKLFSLNELRLLCFRLGVPYEELEGGETRSGKAIELIGYMRRRKRILELTDMIIALRPGAL